VVTNEQLYLAIGIQCCFNATLTGIAVTLFAMHINAKFAAIDNALTICAIYGGPNCGASRSARCAAEAHRRTPLGRAVRTWL